MSSAQKIVKIISFILIALGVLSFVGAGIMAASTGSAPDDVTKAALAAIAIMFFVEGFLDIVYAALGIRGANNPRKIGGFRVLSVFVIAFSVLDVVSAVINDPSSLAQPASFVVYLSLILSVLGFVKSGEIKKLAEK